MPAMLLVTLQFAACALLIGWAGWKLTGYADRIATLTGWSSSWVGLALLATVTSMPELATGISAVAVHSTPDVAIGDVAGSCVVNLALLALVEVLHGKRAHYAGTGKDMALVLGWTILLLATATASFSAPLRDLAILHVSPFSPMLLLLYGLAMRNIHASTNQPAQADAVQAADAARQRETRQVALRFAGAAICVVAAGSALPFLAMRIVALSGLSATFVGTLLVALVTSLPEIVVAVGAVRLGEHRMAQAGLLGSNLFDVPILAIDDLFLPGRSLFGAGAGSHVLTLLTAIAMSGVVAITLASAPRARIGGLTVGGLVLVLLFATSTMASYLAR